MNRRSSHRSYAAPPPSIGAVQSKLLRVVCRHEELKVSFHQLNSQIRTGLFEAEEVFASLAIQLMNLVGLKTTEMAAERRFTTIVTSDDRSHLQEEDYMNKAMAVGNELIERQKLQLMQLVSVLRKIEAQVKSSHKNTFQNLAEHQTLIKRVFHKAISYLSSIPHSAQNNDLFCMMLKILKATFNHVGAAFESVEAGIDDLFCELSDKMCNPMVEYVKGLKLELNTGTGSCLLEIVKEMHKAIQVRTLELEEVRKLAMVAEQSRIEALSRLMKSEETARKLTMSLGLLAEDSTGPEENSTQEKSLSMSKDQAKEDNLIWELLRKKRKSLSDSPLGPNELLGIEACRKKLPSKRMIPSLTHSQSKRPYLRSSFSSTKLLGSSPSATTHKVICGKRVTP